MKRLLTLSLMTISLAACGPLKDMGEMKDTTAHMDQTTTDMDQKMGTMAEQMGQMGAGMSVMQEEMKDMKAVTKDYMGRMIDQMVSMGATTEHMSAKMDELDKKTAAMLDKMNSLHDLTYNMLGKMDGLYSLTNDVKNISAHLGTDTDSLLELTGNLYTDNRQNGALDTRLWLIQMIDNINNTPELQVKADYLTKYFMAFEFQVWKKSGSDTEEKRQALEGNAIQDFFLDLSHFTNGLKLINSYSPLSTDTKTKSLMMISVAMSEPNPNQLDAAKKYGFKVMTLNDILEESLAKKADRDSGKLNPVPPQVDQVLRNEATAVYLLNLRHNVFPMIALTKMTGLDPDYLKKDYGAPLLKTLWTTISNNPVDLSGQNVSQMDEEIDYLAKAIHTRYAVQKLEGSCEISSDIALMLSRFKAVLDPAKMTKFSKEEVALKTSKVSMINTLIDQLNAYHTVKK